MLPDAARARLDFRARVGHENFSVLATLDFEEDMDGTIPRGAWMRIVPVLYEFDYKPAAVFVADLSIRFVRLPAHLTSSAWLCRNAWTALIPFRSMISRGPGTIPNL